MAFVTATTACFDDQAGMSKFLAAIPNGTELAKVLRAGMPASTRAYEDETQTARFVESDGRLIACYTVSEVTIDQAEMIEAAWQAIACVNEAEFRRTVDRVIGDA